MKGFKMLSYLFSAVGFLLIICAFVGRFYDGPKVFGRFVNGGVTAPTVFVIANSFLLLAVLTYLYKKD